MSVTIWITNKCNLSCKYCYVGDKKTNFSMENQTIEKSIEFISNNFNRYKDNQGDYLLLRFHGGEPLIEFEMIKNIVYKLKAKNPGKNLKFAITTNGTILNKEVILFLKNEVHDLTISIDGNKKTQDEMRLFKDGNSCFEKVFKNAKRLQKEIKNLRVRMTYDSNTVYNLYDDIKFLIDEGFKWIVPAGNNFDTNWNDESIKCLEETMIKLREYLRLGKYRDIHISILEKPRYIKKSRCNLGMKSVHIYSNGDLYPCILSTGQPQFNIGNIYSGIDMYKVNKMKKNSENKEKYICNGCAIYDYCDGPRCKIINKIITGSYFIPPSIHCVVENIRYKLR